MICVDRNIKDCESGQTFAYMAIIAVVIMLIAAFVIDLGMVNIIRTRQTDMLQQAIAKCLEPAASMTVKNSDTPGQDLGELLTGFLRDEGFSGELVVYYYEPPSSLTGLSADKRAYAFGARLKTATPTIFGNIAGTSEIDTSVQAFSYSIPYAAERVYKPIILESGTYSVPADGLTGTWRAAASVSALGDESVQHSLEKELNNAIVRATS